MRSAADPAFSALGERGDHANDDLIGKLPLIGNRPSRWRRGGCDGYTSRLPGRIEMLRAILTDSHFWVPVAVLLLGIFLVIRLV